MMQDTNTPETVFTIAYHGKPVGTLTVQMAEAVGDLDVPHLCQTAAAAVCAHIEPYRAPAENSEDMSDDEALPWELTVRFGGTAEGRDLNREFRHKDYATNVLSFPSDDDEPEGATWYVGDIFICVPVLAKESDELEIPLSAHLQHLVVHGMLHLVGYDHDLGEAEAEEMENLERLILADMGLPDPYLAHDVLMMKDA